MKIAIFNGFPFHYEMYGYIIHYCAYQGHSLTIYDLQANLDLGFVSLYQNIFPSFPIVYKPLSYFTEEGHSFDAIFLTTDDDPRFQKEKAEINRKIICIDHYFRIRSPEFHKRIATRPFPTEYWRPWALPLYPILSYYEKIKMRAALPNDTIFIAMVGYSIGSYNIKIMNRLKSAEKKIVLVSIARWNSKDKFVGLRSDIELHILENIPAIQMIHILCQSDYVLINVAFKKSYYGDEIDDDEYVYKSMSGIIPLTFATLTPLILSKETNQYYQFENAITFDKSDENIDLQEQNIEALELERQQHIEKNHNLFSSISNVYGDLC